MERLSKKLAKKQDLIFNHLFFYNAPPFQSPKPNEGDKKRKEEYDSFTQKLNKHKEVTIREGRLQRLKVDGKYLFKQKGVDTLLTMDLMDMPLQNPKIKTVILIASDSDFVPIINRLKKLGIDIILYTYFERNRKSNFSTSNKLLHAVTRYVKLNKQNFKESKL